MYTIVKDGKTTTLVPLTPKQVYDDQIKLKREHGAMGRENQGEDQGERRPSDSARTQNTTTHSQSSKDKQIIPFNHNSKIPKLGRERR